MLLINANCANVFTNVSFITERHYTLTSSFLPLMVHLAHSSEQLCQLIATFGFTKLIEVLRSLSSNVSFKEPHTLPIIMNRMCNCIGV